jgi:kynurenine formamidase
MGTVSISDDISILQSNASQSLRFECWLDDFALPSGRYASVLATNPLLTGRDPDITSIPMTYSQPDSMALALAAMYDSLRDWERWGPGDEHGTLNHLTAERVAAAALSVRSGQRISLGRDIGTVPTAENPFPAQHHMLVAGDARTSHGIPGYEAASDYLGLDLHSLYTTHVDALSHMFVRGQMYGGRPESEVKSTGSSANTVMTMADGVVGRGVLLDVPRVLGRSHFGPDEPIRLKDLETTEAAQGVRVTPGDILVVQWGREAMRVQKQGSLADFPDLGGLHPDCLPWIRERCVSVLGSDGISDPMPGAGYEDWPFPIHQIGITAMGLPLIDNMMLSELSGHCAQTGRWDFLFVMAPLRIARGTGCPVNPVAVV